MAEEDRDLQSYLARIRKTISDSEELVSQAELRIAETDRMLERQGLTREQVMALRFSDAQIEAANAELKRRGLEPLDPASFASIVNPPAPRIQTGEPLPSPEAHMVSGSDELENRQRKFGMMMKPFQI